MLTPGWSDRLALPVVAAPMTGVSGPELVAAACANGVIGAFPTHNAPTTEGLEGWLERIQTRVAELGISSRQAAPVAANVVVHRSNSRRDADVKALIRAGTELVITSVGSPRDVVGPLHDAGVVVFADVATLRHADQALECGVDGLVLLAAGAGGQTGSANPFAFVRAVRERFDGTVVLAGGVSDGTGVAAAQVLGADLVYLGTRFVPTLESLASPDYKAALVAATLDDVTTTDRVSGLPANVLSVWLEAHSAHDAHGLSSSSGNSGASSGFTQNRLLVGQNVWAAGHSVSGTNEVLPVSVLIEQLVAGYRASVERLELRNTSRR